MKMLQKLNVATIFEYKIDNKARDIPPGLDISIKVVEPKQRESLIQKCQSEDIAEMIRGSHISFIALHRDEIVHHTGVSLTHFQHPRVTEKITVNPGEAHIYNVYTIPEYAGKSVAPSVFQCMHKYLQARNIEKCIVHVWTGNLSSQALFRHAGYYEIGKIYLIRVGGSFFNVTVGRRDFFQTKALFRLGRLQVYRTTTKFAIIKRELSPFLKGKSKIVLFGAGGYTRLLLRTGALPASRLSFIVDNNILKQGRYMEGIKLEVKHPRSLLEEEVDLIIIPTQAYQKDILHQLRVEYRIKTPILVLFPVVSYNL